MKRKNETKNVKTQKAVNKITIGQNKSFVIMPREVWDSLSNKEKYKG